MFIKKISFIGLIASLLISINTYGQSNNTDTTMIVNGVCGMCKNTIETAVGDLDGVSEVNWNVDSKVLEVSFDNSKLALNEINLAINKAGYDTEYSTANEEAYQNLHGCCKYRDPEIVKDH